MAKLQPRGKIVPVDIELHFEARDELTESERIDHAVRIVKIQGKDELLFERDLNDKSKIRLTAGSLVLKVNYSDLIDQLAALWKDDLLRLSSDIFSANMKALFEK